MNADADPQAGKRGRHAHDAPDDAAPRGETTEDEPSRHDDAAGDEARDEAPAESPAPPATVPPRPAGATRAAPPEEESTRRPLQPIGRHPAGVSLLIAAGLVTGISLVPLLFERLNWGIALDAAANASSAAAPWPAAAEPWFTPGWVAETAFLAGVAVLLLALIGLKLPDVVVLALAAVLTATTAWAALATLDVLEVELWELIPLCILCIVAFGLAAAATARWRSDPTFKGDEGAGGVAAAALASWLAVAVVLLAGAAIADSARTRVLGDGPPQGVLGLLAVRGEDTGAPDLDDTWWVTLVRQSFRSQGEAEAWCATAGLAPPDCTPQMISG